ncbi:hypothetical protein NVP2275O_450 [Vibrio phage 2.275.O._10N.286.54.E11]|nr:hypothetical protein NVP2275O_450 [Vibrio phage 2.275.O._10N.286.54.E11]
MGIYFTSAYRKWKLEIDEGIEKNADSLREQRDTLNKWISRYTQGLKDGTPNAGMNLEVCMNTRDKMDSYLESLSEADRITYELL